MSGVTPAPVGLHVVLGALVSDGRLLMVHRINAPARWDLPGGHIDEGEPATDALRGELSEELGVEVTAHDPRPIAERPLVNDSGTHLGSLSIWRVRGWHGTPHNAAPEEHDDLRWLSQRDLQELPLVARDTELKLLIRLLNEASE